MSRHLPGGIKDKKHPTASSCERGESVKFLRLQQIGQSVDHRRRHLASSSFLEGNLREKLANGFHARTLPLRPDKTQRPWILIDGVRGVFCAHHPDFLRTSPAGRTITQGLEMTTCHISTKAELKMLHPCRGSNQNQPFRQWRLVLAEQ